VRLHPELQRWFQGRFPDGFTAIQKQALRHTLRGENTLILAPTGSGKTLAAFLSVLAGLGRRAASRAGLPNAVCAVYVSPLRSLSRDIRRNLEAPLEAVNAPLAPERRIRMEVRTGDTDESERARQKRKRPHLLLTTPESLSSVLSQNGWREAFAVATVIVDEIHAFAESKRGTLLALALERLEAKGTVPLQRIGLSATAHPPQAVARLLCGERPCAVAAVDARRAHRLEITVPQEDGVLPAAGHNPYRVAQVVADRVLQAQCSLAFVTTRSAAERLGLALRFLLPEWDEKIAVHHGSVDRAERLAIESMLAEGSLKVVVCSSSLELGVDFAAVDQVLLIGSPKGVSLALQRLGRSGHRVGGVAAGALVPLSLPDVLDCLAIRWAAAQGHLDRLQIPEGPLDVLAQALLGMAIERQWDVEEAWAAVRRAGPYLRLPRADFDAVLEYLAGGGKVLGGYGTFGKITIDDGHFRVASNRVARDYYMNVGTISDEFQIKVVTRANRKLGEVEEGFLASLRPDEAFIMGGRSVVLERMHGTTALVRPARGERVATPRWFGNKMPLTARLAEEELRLRRCLRSAWESGGAAACRRALASEWKASPEVARMAVAFLRRQYRAAPVPVDSPVQVEELREGRNLTLIFHVVAGRDANRSLAWVASRRLGASSSVVAGFTDHAFLLSLSARFEFTEGELKEAFRPQGWHADLMAALESTETLGHDFRPVAETGMLMPRRTFRGPTARRSASWNSVLLYSTFLKHEPEHPLVRETVREVLQDRMNAERASAEAARIFEAPWEIYSLPRPSPFGLAVYLGFSRDVLQQQDPDKALDELAEELYDQWFD
jgi:ATP-dependent helicase Lhr and Lhr-like helicase